MTRLNAHTDIYMHACVRMEINVWEHIYTYRYTRSNTHICRERRGKIDERERESLFE